MVIQSQFFAIYETLFLSLINNSFLKNQKKYNSAKGKKKKNLGTVKKIYESLCVLNSLKQLVQKFLKWIPIPLKLIIFPHLTAVAKTRNNKQITIIVFQKNGNPHIKMNK